MAPEWRRDVEADAFFDTAAAAEHASVEWSFAVAEGDVATILRREARDRDATVVVVATRAEHRGRHRCPARRLVENCDSPVIVVDGDVCGLLEEAW
jgi:nucleotide-binding universal stress UspA family protein